MVIVSLLSATRKELKKCEFELYEAYCMDVIVSTGEGKVCVSDDGKLDEMFVLFFSLNIRTLVLLCSKGQIRFIT